MIVILLLSCLVLVSAVEPTVNCPAPRSPQNGQAFLYQEGQAVKYVCEPGYSLQGKVIVRCVEGQWEDPSPICVKMNFEGDSTAAAEEAIPPPPPIPPTRPLFSWGATELEPEPEGLQEPEESDTNSTIDEDTPMNDEARRNLILYPRRRIVTRRIRPVRVQRVTELEDEQKRRSGSGDASPTTIHLQTPPSIIYVKRTPPKSDQGRMAPVHVNVETGDSDRVLTRAAATPQGDKGYQTYWHDYYPRHASLANYYHLSGLPVATTLSESQIAWINSLHPELRDQYLKDMYATRSNEVEASARAQAYYMRYGDPYYNYYHQSPVYYREPVASLVVEDPISSYDYSCHQAYSSFVKAPKLPNAHIARYDRRQNPNSPHNHYLSAVYRCDPGYVMYDTRYTELHCSQRRWAGPQPVCVPRG